MIVPGCPHHITQRGNRRQRTLLGDDDYQACLNPIADGCRRGGEAGLAVQKVLDGVYCSSAAGKEVKID